MKALDPAFFIAIEDDLKETTKSDTVKASLRRATVEAATEILETNSNHKNQKVKKVLSAKQLQNERIELLNKVDKKNTQKFFEKANREYPVYVQTQPPSSSNGFSEKDMKKLEKQA